MNKTAIDYLDYTWNPLAMRCTPVSEGCANCWHIKRAKMLAHNPNIPEDVQEAYANLRHAMLIESRLHEPLKLKKPSRIGVQFMGDLFHVDVGERFIGRIFGHIAAAWWHTFLILTKRPENMAEFSHGIAHYPKGNEWQRPISGWPPNAWLGVTVENDRHLDRIEDLLKIPAAVRFVSYEPALGAVSFRWMPVFNGYATREKGSTDHLDGLRLLNWVIIGTESGPGRRPMKLEWAVDVVQECQEAGVPVFVKQIEIAGKVSHDVTQWPEELRVREYPRGVRG